jgi:hypothetical protein
MQADLGLSGVVVMSEVNAFLQANGGDEEGITGEEKEVAKSRFSVPFLGSVSI